MRDFQAIYQSKLITMEQVLGMIPSNSMIVLGNNALIPFKFLDNAHKLKGKVKNVGMIHTGLTKPYPFITDPSYKDTFRLLPTFSDPYTYRAHDTMLSSAIPSHIANGSVRLAEEHNIDFFISGASRMDRYGNVFFSLNNFSEQLWANTAKTVILEINKALPITNGTTEFPIEEVDYIVEVDYDLYCIPEIPISAEEAKIGRYVASLVEDGSTIQLGIGGIPNAVGKAFETKNDLGVHTEMITTVIQSLANKGVITGKRKTLYPRKIVGTFALGNQDLYNYIDNNPSVWLMGGSLVADRRQIMKNYRMVSVNTALQVDLFGQISSESLGGIQYSGTGGAADYAYGSTNAPEGKSIIALRSTAKGGTLSTITPHLSSGSIVSVSRNDIDFIVTEYGIAKMRSKSIRERMENLINIAHPDFRDGLKQQAKELKIW